MTLAPRDDRYNFTQILDEATLRHAIETTPWHEHAAFGALFGELTARFPQAKGVLLRIAQDPKEPDHLHGQAMWALSRIGGEDAIQAFLVVANGTQFSTHERYHAPGWIACIPGTASIDALESLIFGDTDDSVKRGALYGLETFAQPEEAAQRVIARVRAAVETDRTLRRELMIDDREAPL